jgi:hypothetical protein
MIDKINILRSLTERGGVGKKINKKSCKSKSSSDHGLFVVIGSTPIFPTACLGKLLPDIQREEKT